MSKRRLDKLEGSLSPKEAVLRWLGEAHAFGSLPAYTTSLIDEPVAAQPFVAVPAQVEKAIWGAMSREKRADIEAAIREAVADTAFLLRLVTGLNTHIEEVLRLEQLRRASLYWWWRSFDPERRVKTPPPPEWSAAVATLVGTVRGTEEALRGAEARYLDGHDCLFPELASEWRDLCAAAEQLAGGRSGPDEGTARRAGAAVQGVARMARADGLDAAGQHRMADVVAERVLTVGDLAAPGDTGG